MILKPVKGTFPWPGRDRLSPRDRLLLESRTVEELFQGLGRLDAASDLESVLGFFEFLIMDWRWLHDVGFRALHPGYYSRHAAFLRQLRSYGDSIGWRGPIPRTDAVSDCVASMMN